MNAPTHSTEPRRDPWLGSIRAKLGLVILTIVTVSIIGTIGTLSILLTQGNSLFRLESKLVPRIVDSQAFSKTCSDLAKIGLRLPRVSTLSELEELEQRFNEQLPRAKELRERVTGPSSLPLNTIDEELQALENDGGVLIDSIRSSLTDRQALGAELRGMIDRADSIQRGIENAPWSSSSGATAAQVEVDLLIIETQLRQLSSAQSRAEADVLNQQIQTKIRGLVTELRAFDAELKVELASFAQLTLRSLPDWVDRIDVLMSASIESEDLLAKIEQASADLQDSAFFVSEGIQSDVAATVARGREELRLAWIVSLVVATIAAVTSLIAAAYVEYGLARRLQATVRDIERVSRGDLEHPVQIGGDAELVALGKAAEVFRSVALELRTTTEELSERNQLLDDFIHIASHDLKAPLRHIHFLAECAEEDAGSGLTTESKEHLEHLRGRSAELQRMLDGLLQYSRLVHSETVVEDFEVKERISKLAESLDLERTEVEVSGDAIWVTLPTPSFDMIIRNLLTNSVKHHDRDRCRVEIHVAELGQTFRMTIVDDGPGIPYDHEQAAFEMFKQLGSTQLGSGMGLALVRGAATRMGGSCALDPTPRDRGASFIVELPHQARPLTRSDAAEPGPLSREILMFDQQASEPMA